MKKIIGFVLSVMLIFSSTIVYSSAATSTLKLKDGTYTGEVLKGKMHGEGIRKFTTKDNMVYDGIFENGIFVSGTMTYSDSKFNYIYEGGTYDSDFNGYGTWSVYFKDTGFLNYRIKQYWESENWSAFKEITYSDGMRIVGFYEGEQTFVNGGVYDIYCKDGNIYRNAVYNKKTDSFEDGYITEMALGMLNTILSKTYYTEFPNYRLGIDMCNYLIEINPQFYKAYYLKSMLLRDTFGHYDPSRKEEIECYMSMIDIDPTHSLGYYGLATVMYQMEEFDAALECSNLAAKYYNEDDRMSDDVDYIWSWLTLERIKSLISDVEDAKAYGSYIGG